MATEGRGGIRAMQLILGLSWPAMSLSCMCLLVPHKAEGILEHLTLLILVEELEREPQLTRGSKEVKALSPNEQYCHVLVFKDAGIS